MKICVRCGVDSFAAEFQNERLLCKACYRTEQRQRAAERRLLNPDKHRISVRNSKYNITNEIYDSLLNKQDNKCAICHKEFSNISKFHKPWVDHDHKCCPLGRSCGKCIRGLLCANCNKFLGHINDDPKIADRMGNYLRNK